MERFNPYFYEDEIERKFPKTSNKKKSRVGYKISKLVKEGKPHNQAVAIALNMEKNGRLGPRGGYIKSK